MKKIFTNVILLLLFPFVMVANEFGSFSKDLTDENIPLANIEQYFDKWFDTGNCKFIQVREWEDELNTVHRNYQQYLYDIPVKDCMILVHAKNDTVYSVNGQVVESSKLPTSESGKENTRSSSCENGELVILKVNTENGSQYKKALKYVITENNILKSYDLYLDAETGDTLKKVKHSTNVQGTAHTLYKGEQTINCFYENDKYYLFDEERNIVTMNAKDTTNVVPYENTTTTWGNSGNLSLTSVVITSIPSTSWFYAITDQYPDLYIVIKDSLGNILYKSSETDDTKNFPYTFTIPSIKSTSFSIQIYDYDPIGDNDYAGSFNFKVSKYGEISFSNTNITGHVTIDYDNINDKTALDTHWGTEMAYDYFLNTFNRKGFNGRNGRLINYIADPRKEINNASAIGFDTISGIFIGMGDNIKYKPFASLDVVAHEFTHCVTATNGNGGLNYEGESGALNESFSDIFAICTDFYVGIDPNWFHNEDGIINHTNSRDLSNPNNSKDGADPLPDTYSGLYWINTNDLTEENDHGGVHTNCGPQSFWFYLLCEGGSGINDNVDLYDVEGIGMEDAEKIAYRNLTTYLTPNATYEDACNGSLLATMDLFGKESQQYESVCNAWFAVGLNAKAITENDEISNDQAIKPTMFSKDKTLYIQTKEGQNLSVYTLMGQLLHQQEITDETIVVPNIPQSLVIVKIDNKSYKVIIK